MPEQGSINITKIVTVGPHDSTGDGNYNYGSKWTAAVAVRSDSVPFNCLVKTSPTRQDTSIASLSLWHSGGVAPPLADKRRSFISATWPIVRRSA